LYTICLRNFGIRSVMIAISINVHAHLLTYLLTYLFACLLTYSVWRLLRWLPLSLFCKQLVRDLVIVPSTEWVKYYDYRVKET